MINLPINNTVGTSFMSQTIPSQLIPIGQINGIDCLVRIIALSNKNHLLRIMYTQLKTKNEKMKRREIPEQAIKLLDKGWGSYERKQDGERVVRQDEMKMK